MSENIVVLTGGVGGAKLVLGLTHLVPAGDLMVIVNTGDDFRHLGLHISPDIDTLLYTLSGKADAGWGWQGESWNFMDALGEIGGETWFSLGDRDLALHVIRTMRLKQGNMLSAIVADFATHIGVSVTVLPMTDDPVGTYVHSDEGTLEFQRYFVERRCIPKVHSVEFRGAANASPLPAALDAIAAADIILVAPSNPFLSIDPILALPSLRAALELAKAPVVAVSPIMAGNAVKGPTAKMMSELGIMVDNRAIVAHYRGLIDGLVAHDGDSVPDEVPSISGDILMLEVKDKVRVAGLALALGRRLCSP